VNFDGDRHTPLLRGGSFHKLQLASKRFPAIPVDLPMVLDRKKMSLDKESPKP
jgi:hypothetical protein